MASIATAYVEILPETAKVAAGIEKALRGVDVRKIARDWGREIQQSIGDPTVTLDADTKEAEKKLDKATKDRTAEVRVDADTTAAEAELDALTRDRKATINVDATGAAIGSSLATGAVNAGAEAGGGGIQGFRFSRTSPCRSSEACSSTAKLRRARRCSESRSSRRSLSRPG